MATAIHKVFRFISDHRDYRLSLGVISSAKAGETLLAWGAVKGDGEDIWVPELENIQSSWPDAQWTPVNQQQAALFDSAYQRDFSPRNDWLLSI